MSKLFQALKLTDTGKVLPTLPSLSVSEKFSDSISNTMSRRYVMEVKFRRDAMLSNTLAAIPNSNYLQDLRKHTASAIVEEIFGEFREPLADIRSSVMAGDARKACHQLESLYNQMFYE